MSVGSRRLLATLLVALAAMLGLASRPVQAQSLNLGCSFSMTNIAFGSVDVLPGTAVASSGTLSISCLNVTVSSGSLSVCVALPTPRVMAGPSAGFAYDIFGPSPATTSWSNTTPIVIPLSSLRLLATVTVPIAAGVLGGQASITPGSYIQTVAATVTYGVSSCTTGQAGTGSFSFQVAATVVKSCLVTATSLGFGSIGDLNAPVDSASALSVQCTNGTGYVIALDGGLSGASDPTARKMTSGSGSITYGLYRDAVRTAPWGASTGTNTNAGTGTAATQSIPVYGRVPAQATPSLGTYSDTIVVSVTY